MVNDFAAHCDEQIAIADALRDNLMAERARLTDDQAASAGNRKQLQRLEWRLMVLDREVAHLDMRRSYWASVKARGFDYHASHRPGGADLNRDAALMLARR